MTVHAHKETLNFQAEARQVLKLVIHSLYSNKEIFLRELISNASDACDKLRFEALTDDALYEGDSRLRVRMKVDREARTLTISDNGIGMSRQEVADNIGTIARSGTRRFLEALSGDQAKDVKLIGQFGVGFYSAFVVADRVAVRTRRAGLGSEHGVCWESDGEGEYSLETIELAQRGSEIVLHLREGEDEFLDGWHLREIVRRYSDSLSLPIEMPAEKGKDAEGKGEGESEWETINRASALWTRSRRDIKDDEYREFYKHVAHDFEDPLAWVHSQVEGTQSYTTLFYLPKRAPFDLWERDRGQGIKLYVRRVFVLEDTERLMPNYLRFVRGIVDSDDLPLNVSREILQQNRQIDVIRGASVKKVLGLLQDLADREPEKYRSFWNEFGRVLKEGPVEDYNNREAIAKLLRFASTHDNGAAGDVSLDAYIERMKPAQDRIWYLTADSATAAAGSPHLEVFRRKGIEVLLLSDRVDEWMLSALREYAGKPLASVAKGDLDFGALDDEPEKDQAQNAAAEGELQDVFARMKTLLQGKIKDVRPSRRLTDSAACLVVEKDDMTLGLRRLLESTGQQVPVNLPVLEVNARHPLTALLKMVDAERFDDLAHVLYEQALLSEGAQLEDPVAFVRRLNTLLVERAGAGS
ncbi:MAG: molecular chaperone HtpG [Chromatiales bacterium]|jgi:molecular chaperone HtpG|nr:molecular chaperone HtpG [Chromatiales bacterium]